MIEQIKKVAEQLEENESKKLLLESEITYLEEVLKHGVSSRFAEENAIYIYSPKTGHEIRRKLEDDYKLMHSKFSIPKKIAEELDTILQKYPGWIYEGFHRLASRSLMMWCENNSGFNNCVAYLAGKALGVELVEIEG